MASHQIKGSLQSKRVTTCTFDKNSKDILSAYIHILLFSLLARTLFGYNMFFARWVILLSLQAVFLNTTLSTVSEGSSDESPSAISLIQTTQISFYMELISLVNCSCDLEDEETPDIKLACAHMTNATRALRTFLAPLSDILPTGDQVNMLHLKVV